MCKHRKPRCELCGDDWSLERHHIIPIVCGGTNDRENMITLCGRCHARLTPTALLTKYGMKAVLMINRADLLRLIRQAMDDGATEAGEILGVVEQAPSVKAHVVDKRKK